MASLFHTQVTPADRLPTRWMLVLHGLLGRGSNWRTFARSLVDARPDWGAVLVDLRMHGDSQGFAPPHTVASAAADLDTVADGLPGKVDAVLGHSLGGKVALAWAARRQGLAFAFLLDTNPGPRPSGRGSETTQAVLSLLRTLPSAWPSREAFVQKVEAAGQPSSMARWLAMNLQHTEGGFTFGLELSAMQSLLDDVLHQDDWPLLESPPAGLAFHVILGGKSRTVEGEDFLRMERLAAQGRLTLTVLPGAGHWVQVDAPAPTLRAVSEALS